MGNDAYDGAIATNAVYGPDEGFTFLFKI